MPYLLPNRQLYFILSRKNDQRNFDLYIVLAFNPQHSNGWFESEVKIVGRLYNL